jgi:hypothetical protein
MRNPERIPIILKYLDLKQFIIDLKVFDDDQMIDTLIDFHTSKEKVKNFWKENPDYRLVQVLIALNFLPNSPGFWYYTEEEDYLLEKDLIKFEDIKFWGVNYYKNSRKRPKTKFKLLKDLDIEHIRAILKYFGNRDNQINPKYLQYFKKRLLEENKDELNNI